METNISLQFLMIIQDMDGFSLLKINLKHLVPSSNGTNELKIFSIKILNILKLITALNIIMLTLIIFVMIMELHTYIVFVKSSIRNGLQITNFNTKIKKNT